MSVEHWSSIRCDGCGQLAGAVEEMRPSAAQARKVAAGLGWVSRRRPAGYNRRLDLCPECAK
jgi:hypothetical protein